MVENGRQTAAWLAAVAALALLVAGAGAQAAQAAQEVSMEREVATGMAVSPDGTSIAYERSGQGPLLVLVSPALSTKEAYLPLAGLLAEQFTVVSYDRRGRGGSGDTQPYSVLREVEDLEAVIDAAGGPACLFGTSSGAVLALEAAARLSGKVSAVVLHEPPFIVDASRPPVPADFVEQVNALVAAGKREDAVAYFMTAAVGIPPEYVEQMRQSPMWGAMATLAHTLAYDVTVMGATQAGLPLPAERWTAVQAPTLVLAGGASEPWLQNSAQALVALLAQAEYMSLPGLDHGAAYMAPEALVPVIAGFLLAGSAAGTE